MLPWPQNVQRVWRRHVRAKTMAELEPRPLHATRATLCRSMFCRDAQARAALKAMAQSVPLQMSASVLKHSRLTAADVPRPRPRDARAAEEVRCLPKHDGTLVCLKERDGIVLHRRC